MARVAVCLLLAMAWALPALAAEEDESCLKCHNDHVELAKAIQDPARMHPGLLLDRARWDRSVHASMGCGECHYDYDGQPHSEDAETVACADCHDGAAEQFGHSVHAKAEKGAARCQDCHGTHDILRTSERDSRVHPLNVCETCGSCHFDAEAAERTGAQLVAERLTDNAHCRFTLRGGLVNSATCVSCHGGHDVRGRGDPESLMSRAKVADTCGQCHVGVVERYRAGEHHLSLEAVQAGKLVCSECHAPHPITEPTGDATCLRCHGDPGILVQINGPLSRPAEQLVVDQATYARSVHGARGCVKCHTGYDTQPHTAEAKTTHCSACHEEAEESFARSAHAKAKEGNERLPDCGSCHGVHNVLPASERDSTLYPLNVHVTCGQCHFSLDPMQMEAKDILRERYAGDVHGYGLQKSGLMVSATCVSCHGGHEIRESGDPDSEVARHHVDRVCGKCHVGALEDYRKSVHFLKSEGLEHKGATCTDCHHPHQISAATDAFRTESVRACSNCHEQRSGTYRLTFHGKSTSLGFGGRVATCESCHGNHAIRPVSDAKSRVHADNLVKTCGECHEGSHEEFTNYIVHADPYDGDKYPVINGVYVFMRTLLIIVLILGVAHVLLWLVRATAAGDWKRPAIPPEQRRWFRRWPRSYVTYHMVLMTSVLTLATTGLPIHFADQPWALNMMRVFGGPEITGWIHRVAALVMVGLGVAYLIHLAWRIVARREKGLFFGPNTMLPRVKDLQDLIGNFKWFLWRGPRPRYDRWTYWEKFDFWAVFWGLFVIGLTGWMLWAPVWWTRFVPGWMINAAVIVHGIEALLDIAFIFTVHVFHANLRPDKFPMDTMFLTGKMTEHEFRHERPEEYDRMLAENRLEAMLAQPPTRRSRITAYVIGTCAFLVGFFFVAMMIVAVVEQWI